MPNLKYYLAILILIWLFGFLYILSNNSNNNNTNKANGDGGDSDGNDNNNIWSKRLDAALAKLQRLEERNRENQELIQTLKLNADALMSNRIPSRGAFASFVPSLAGEESRRKVFADVQDINFYINAQTNKKLSSEEGLKKFKKDIQDRVNVILANVYNLTNSDSLGAWRKEEIKKLSNKVNRRFDELQNPKDCHKAKKIVCDLNKACGFGCQIHHVMYCFITSYSMNRTLILESKNWRYNQNGYEAYFRPVSDTCTSTTSKPIIWGESGYEKADSIKMPIIDVLGERPKFLPLAVPNDLLPQLRLLHNAPFVWWAGQLISYLMRFNDEFDAQVKKIKENLKFQTPCVGIHVRRTDKVGTEASYHDLDEYMKDVDEYFDLHEYIYNTKNKSNSVQRTVYLATDEIKVHQEAKKRYPNHVFIYDESFSKTASVNVRYTPESVVGVIMDTYLLSQCDYLVCTFSSQVCRMAYELMQTRYADDASWRFRSLDDVYYYGGQSGHDVEAIYENKANAETGEIELKVGDLIGLAGNHWNGYSKGLNHRTSKEGLFPSYKVRETIRSF